ncbi:MAG: dTDP-4-dehydrorhamnose 3,5-epimerase [Bacteroidetes bacterium]|nr:MAG: dTDP-4-dehydrorhamnose 3,5-epimerase [Bacteroidota bacterium]TAG86110.1 MAG: dTDP-4-dehydrorhamnose 3,5-epimerase [Bacteroidota bacterium]
MPFVTTPIQGLYVFEPRLFVDERGYFYESFNLKQFSEATGFEGNFVQDNHSYSTYGVMRGLHLQLPPNAQSKLVRVVNGEVYDVAVDVRKKSPTYGQHFGVNLSAENKKQFFIPQGFAHGFVVLSESAELLYKCDNYYAPQSESGLLYNDKDLNIDWKVSADKMLVSGKDLLLKTLKETEINF